MPAATSFSDSQPGPCVDPMRIPADEWPILTLGLVCAFLQREWPWAFRLEGQRDSVLSLEWSVWPRQQLGGVSTELLRGWEKLAQTSESLDAERWAVMLQRLLLGGLVPRGSLHLCSGEEILLPWRVSTCPKELLPGVRDARLPPPLAPTTGAGLTRSRSGRPPRGSGHGAFGFASSSPSRVAGVPAPGWTASAGPGG